MTKQRVALFGASGTMGFQAFKELWKQRDRYEISLLALPSDQKLQLFQPYEKEAGLPSIQGSGVAQGDGLKIVWGDARRYLDVLETVCGVDWVLDAMAYISPAADYHPDMAKAVNIGAIRNILRAIQAQPGGLERIHFIYTGTVAQTGNRPAGIHMGRVGDPLKPSIFDTYALTKIAGEREVIESPLKYWASLRMSFIMPTDFREWMGLMDPILLHMPLGTLMENLTDRDAGLGLVNCLDIPDDSDFWRRVYNMGGGPAMRCTAQDYLDQSMRLIGLGGLQTCTQQRWFSLRNFHLHYYEDSHLLNDYLNFWRDSLPQYWQHLKANMPAEFKLLTGLCNRFPVMRHLVEKNTCNRLAGLAEKHHNGTAYWRQTRNDRRIHAFFGSYDAYDGIGEWNGSQPSETTPAWRRLEHGYDEGKSNLETVDLQSAATFRGGQLLSVHWNGDLYAPLIWKCAFGHSFQARPYSVLKAGHWCPECIQPPWNYDQQAKVNPYFAQVWYADHDPVENYVYPEDCSEDILNADLHWHPSLGKRTGWRAVFPLMKNGIKKV